MAVINVPKPPKKAFNKNRPLSTLLGWQIYHVQEAELSLPVGQSTDVYVNAIKTEGEAADYIRRVTQKVHELHGAPIAKPKKKARKVSRRGFEIAAVGKTARKRTRTSSRGTTRKKKA